MELTSLKCYSILRLQKGRIDYELWVYDVMEKKWFRADGSTYNTIARGKAVVVLDD